MEAAAAAVTAGAWCWQPPGYFPVCSGWGAARVAARTTQRRTETPMEYLHTTTPATIWHSWRCYGCAERDGGLRSMEHEAIAHTRATGHDTRWWSERSTMVNAVATGQAKRDAG